MRALLRSAKGEGVIAARRFKALVRDRGVGRREPFQYQRMSETDDAVPVELSVTAACKFDGDEK